MLTAQQAFIIWVQAHLHPQWDLFFSAISFFGTVRGVLIITTLITWTIDYSFGVRLLLMNLVTQYVNSLWLKAIIALPRPFQTVPDIIAIVPGGDLVFHRATPSMPSSSSAASRGSPNVGGRRASPSV